MVFDIYSVLYSVAVGRYNYWVGAVEVTCSATGEGSDGSERGEDEERVNDEAGEFAARATRVAQAEERQQEEAESDVREPA